MMEFDSKAKEWDKDPVKIERAEKFAHEIKQHLPQTHNGTAMEFGSGTGQVSLFLKDQFRQIHLVDSSQGMIEVLRENIRQRHIKNMVPMWKDVFMEELDLEKLDAIYTLMTLHHIEDLEKVLDIFYNALKAGGMLFIGDLDKEDGSFHDHAANFKGHNGFHRHELKKKLEGNGFLVQTSHEFYSLVKTFPDGTKKVFPLFFMIAVKKN